MPRPGGRPLGTKFVRPSSSGDSNSVSVGIDLEGMEEVFRLFDRLKPAQQRAVLRSAGTKAGTIVRKTAKRLAPVGFGMNERGEKRKHLKDALVQNTLTKRNGLVSTVIGSDYRIAPHIHLAHEGASATVSKPKNARFLTNFALVRSPLAPIFGKRVEIPQRRAQPFLKDALEANKSQIEALYVNAIRKAIAKVTT